MTEPSLRRWRWSWWWLGLAVVASMLAGSSAQAEPEAPPPTPQAPKATSEYFITDIHLQGLSRTEPHVVHRELLVEEGQPASFEVIEESIQRVRNTGIFRKVDFDLSARMYPGAEHLREDGIEPVVLHISVDEKWTLLPIFSFNRGGGTHRLTVGAFDTNLLGRYISVGGQFQRLGDANSFYVWANHPRLFDQRLRLGVDLGTQNRVYSLYGDSGELEGGFLRRRLTVGTHLRREWVWWFRTQVTLRYADDDFSYDLLSSGVEQMQRDRGLPPESHRLSGGISAMFGRIDQDNFLLDGAVGSITVEHANAQIGSSHTNTQLLVGTTAFKSLPFKTTIGGRVAAGFGSFSTVQDRFYLGGLDALRGFASDRFSGEHYWLANAEVRIPSVDSRWFVIQHTFFGDVAGAADEVSGLDRVSGASAGLGVRLLIPKIYGFIARIDYAFPIHGAVNNPMSLGGGQFF